MAQKKKKHELVEFEKFKRGFAVFFELVDRKTQNFYRFSSHIERGAAAAFALGNAGLELYFYAIKAKCWNFVA